jgi:hypothetical protein
MDMTALSEVGSTGVNGLPPIAVHPARSVATERKTIKEQMRKLDLGDFMNLTPIFQ